MLVSSHLMNEMQDTADHVIVVGRGKVIADATVSEVLARWPSLEAAYLELTRNAVDYRGVPGGRPPGQAERGTR